MTFTVNTKSAVYEFTTAPGQVHVTKWILKGCKGAHVSTSTDLTSARKWIKQLKAATK